MMPANNKNDLATINETTDPQRERGVSDMQSAYQPLALRSMFWRPHYIEASTWQSHIPFAFWLIEAHRPANLIQIGIPDGTSYFAFCQAIDRLSLYTNCYLVDINENSNQFLTADAEAEADETVLRKVKSTNEHCYSSFSKIVQEAHDKVATGFPDGSVDLLHIQNLPTRTSAREIFETWRPKLSDRAIVLLHSTSVKGGPETTSELFIELQRDYPAFEFPHGHGLGVLGVGQSHNELIKFFFKSNKENTSKQAIWEVFSRLGKACVDSFNAVKRDERVDSLEKEVKKYRANSERLQESLEKAVLKISDGIEKIELSEKKTNSLEDNNKKLVEKYEIFLLFLMTEFLPPETIPAVSKLLAHSDVQRSQVFRNDFDLNARTLVAHLTAAKAEYDVKSREIIRCNNDIAQLSNLYISIKKKLAAENEVSDALRNDVLDVQRQLRIATHKSESQVDDCGTIFLGHALALEKLSGEDTVPPLKGQTFEDYNKRLGLAIEKVSRALLAEKSNLETHEQNVHNFKKLVSRTSQEKTEQEEKLKKLEDQLTTENNSLKNQIQELSNNISLMSSREETLRNNLGEKDAELAHLAKIIAGEKNFNPDRVLARHDIESAEYKNIPETSLVTLIRSSGLFDEEWYLAENRDVAESQSDPIEHYLRYGASEGRDPSPIFSSVNHLNEFPELFESKINPLVHYISTFHSKINETIIIGSI